MMFSESPATACCGSGRGDRPGSCRHPDDSEAAGRRRRGCNSRRPFRLVAGGQDEGAGLVGQRHEDDAADAGLQVFFRGVGGPAGEFSASMAAKVCIAGSMAISS